MKLFAVKTPSGLHPTPECQEDYDKIGMGEIIEVELRKRRNIRFHRKFFALLQVSFANQDRYDNPEVFRKMLLYEAGYFNILSDGPKVILDVQSISFGKCDELKFREIYNHVLDVILERYCLGSTKEAIDEAVLRVLDFS